MPELFTFARGELPPLVAAQIRSYARVQWPFMTKDFKKLWTPEMPGSSLMHFVVMDDELLISHAGVNCRELLIGGQTLKVFGLSTVFTYPDYRKGGFARQAVAAASEFIRASDGDVAMLYCGEPLRSFYMGCGWEPVDTARIFYGNSGNPTHKNDNLIMMMFITEKGRESRVIFETQDVFVGPNTW